VNDGASRGECVRSSAREQIDIRPEPTGLTLLAGARRPGRRRVRKEPVLVRFHHFEEPVERVCEGVQVAGVAPVGLGRLHRGAVLIADGDDGIRAVLGRGYAGRVAELTPQDERALDDLRASLLRRPRPNLRPEQGDEAFDQHMLLAAAIHRAAGLFRSGGDGETWRKYVTAFFPEGRNAPEDAEKLWVGWRTSLLKNEQPVVPITHGQSDAHWRREHGYPVLNLEDAWDDYRHSVERFIEHLRSHPDERANTLRRWRERSWTVRQIQFDPEPTVPQFQLIAASAASSASVIAPPPRR
jgi:hypothetical protein